MDKDVDERLNGSLSDLLSLKGYMLVPLERGKEGQLHATASLNGRILSAFLDTGATRTVVSLSLVNDMGLAVTKVPFRVGGAGAAALELFEVPGVDFRLHGVAPRTATLLATDLDRVNLARRQHGDLPIDVIVGADFFLAHDAVLDFRSCNLFIWP